MPLRAIIDGANIFSFDLTNIQWEQLREKVKSKQVDISFPCCGSRVGLRTSKLGTNHFYHITRGDCTSAPETAEHLLAKRDIVIACREMGYEAITEYAENDWRADVMAIKGSVRIAFEVQWSPQTLQRTMERQERYKKAGVRGYWFFRRIPISEHYPAIRDLPMFQIMFEDSNTPRIVFEEQKYMLGEFAKFLINGEIRYCDRVTAKPEQIITVRFIRTSCWDCGAFYYVYQIINRLKTDCGRGIEYHLYFNNPDSDLYFAFHPEVLEAVKSYVLENEYGIDLAGTTGYYAKWKKGMQEAFECPHCQAKLGHPYLMKDIYYNQSRDSITVDIPVKFRNPPSLYECDPDEDIDDSDDEDDDMVIHVSDLDFHGHWCMPENGVFCCDKNTTE